MFKTYFIFRQQKIKFKPMSGMKMLLCDRMFCRIFCGFSPLPVFHHFWFFQTSGFCPLPVFHSFRFFPTSSFSISVFPHFRVFLISGLDPNQKWWKKWNWWKNGSGENRKWWKNGGGTKPEVCSNQKLDSNYWNEAKLLRNYSICQL